MNFNDIKSDEVVPIGNITVESIPLNHPYESLGYKITCENRSVAYISDHEHTEESKQSMVDFLKDTNLVIFDAQYTPEEYSGSDGGGGIVHGRKSLLCAGKQESIDLFSLTMDVKI